jgi:hypothetical protein
MYRLIQDNDCHWYIIPADKENEFYEWDQYCIEYWNNFENEGHAPIKPKWVVEVGGSPSLVQFPSYQIN